MYQLGTIKLTWIDPNDYTVLESKMFKANELELALKTADTKKDWMLFQLQKNYKDDYSWKLLPYGTSESFVRSMKLRDSLILPYIGIAGAGLFIYLILDKISRSGGK